MLFQDSAGCHPWHTIDQSPLDILLEFEEKENVIVVRKKLTEAKGLTEETYASLDSREVKISAIFFEADVNELKERGINWQLLMSNADVTSDSKLRSFTE